MKEPFLWLKIGTIFRIVSVKINIYTKFEMKNCIFCQIVEGKIPCFKVYEDTNFLAFLDIAPLNPGHTLIIPKKHYRYVDDILEFGKYFEIAKRIGKAIKKVTGYEHIYYLSFGNMVEHAHIWVMPHFKGDKHGDSLNDKARGKLTDKEGKDLSEKLAKAVNDL